ncbi:MAG: gamma-glutamylcyclotransferase family protein [Candidatus Paceibacterota bacterium]|jgi:gamma-glutamylcyclotransferase (GGCT)/AIG2-like uncharacterized protein YtfP
MIFYFAYGSNMDEKQMRERCPDARFVSVARLDDFKLDFTIHSPKRQCGCADVVFARGEKTYGILYEMSAADILRLDGFESVPTAYIRNTKGVKSADGKMHKAFVYEVADKKEFIAPSADYLNLILNAAQKHSFPKDYTQGLVTLIPQINNEIPNRGHGIRG